MYYQKYFNDFHESIKLNSILMNKSLMNKVNCTFDNERDKMQFIRIVDYLKVWEIVNISTYKDSVSIESGIINLASEYFIPERKVDDSDEYIYDDLKALKNLLNKIINRFIILDSVEQLENLFSGISANCEKDIFCGMCDNKIDEFNQKVCELYNILNAVQEDVINGCEFLQEAFGDNFPTPKKAA